VTQAAEVQHVAAIRGLNGRVRPAKANQTVVNVLALQPDVNQIQAWACLHEGQRRTEDLRDMRLEALRMKRILRPLRPD